MAEEFTAKFKVDISDLKKNITEASKDIKLADAAFKAATAGMDNWSKNADGLSAKLKSLNSILNSQKSVLASYKAQLERQQQAYEQNGQRAEQLKAKLQELAQNGVAKTDEEYKKYESALKSVLKEQESNASSIDKLKLSLLNQEAAVGKTEKEIRKYEQAEQAMGEGAEDAEKDVRELGDAAEEAGNDAEKGGDGFTVFKGIVANLASDAIKAAVNGLKELGKAVLNLGKESLAGYSEMEQLKGGVEKLFGEDTQAVLDNANEAYKTAGMNANEYMETVTSFSASLISSLGGDTAKAARYADMAISDMSDNANTFGSDIGTIQSAYQGFAKQNYNMLDNLKLGYGGTKSEMERLIKDAEKLNKGFKAQRDEAGNLKMSYGDIVDAIHIVQTNMKITGTTAREASKTIEGSVNATKAAWKNLVNSLGDSNADIGKLTRNVISSAKDVVNNVIPIVENIAKAIPEAITEIINAVEDSGLVDSVLDVASEVFESLFKKLPTLMTTLGEKVAELLPKALQTLSKTLPTIITSLFDSIANILTSIDIGQLVSSLFDCLNTVIKSIVPRLPELLIQLVAGIIEALPELFVGVGETIYNIFDGLFSGYSQFDQFKTKIDEQTTAWQGVTGAMGEAVDKINADAGKWQTQWEMLQNITDESGKVKDGYGGLARTLIKQLNGALGLNIELIKGQIQDYDTLKGKIDELIEKKRAEMLLQAEEEAYSEALKMRPELVEAVADAEANRAKAQEEVNRLEEEYNALVESGADLSQWEIAHDQAIISLDEMNAAYNQASANLNENTSLMAQYMDDYTAALNGDYTKIGTQTKAFTGQSKADLEAYKNDVKAQLDQDTANHDSWLKDYEETHRKYSKEQADYYARRIENDQKSLDAINELVESEGEEFDAAYVNGLLSGEGNVDSTARGIANTAKTGIGSQNDAMYTIGGNAAAGFAAGMGDKGYLVEDAAYRLAAAAKRKMEMTLEVASPSKVTKRIGRFVDMGLAEGISDNAKMAIKEAVGLALEVKKALTGNVTAGGIKSALTASASATRASAGGVFGSGSSAGSAGNVTNYTQIINAPKQPSRLELYRQTKNLLAYKSAL